MPASTVRACTLRPAGSLSNVGNGELSPIGVRIAFVGNGNSSSLRFQYSLEVKFALIFRALPRQKLDKPSEPFLPRSCGAFHVRKHSVYHSRRRQSFKLC